MFQMSQIFMGMDDHIIFNIDKLMPIFAVTFDINVFNYL
jgi:hypothetical protein